MSHGRHPASATSLHRRRLLKAGAAGVMTYTLGGTQMLLTPAVARARGADLSVLTALQARTLDGLGETLLPGAAKAGIAHFVDAQLAADPAEALFMIRYFDVPPPWAEFYRSGLDALDAAARRRLDQGFAELPAEDAGALIASLATDAVEGWDGPAAELFYLVCRSDAVDAVYGTTEGFKTLGIGYLPHIRPRTPW